LCIFGASEGNYGIRNKSETESSDEASRNGAWEIDMVEESQITRKTAGTRRVSYEVVCCLEVEGFFDLGVGCDDEVEDDNGGYDKGEKNIWERISYEIKLSSVLNIFDAPKAFILRSEDTLCLK
jgi:hypothetical protein